MKFEVYYYEYVQQSSTIRCECGNARPYMQTIPGTLFQKYYVGGCAVNTGFLISHSFYPLAKYARNIPTMLSYDKKKAVLVILLNVSRGSPCTVAGKIGEF